MLTREADVWLGHGYRYEFRLRARLLSGSWTAWRNGTPLTMTRLGETASNFDYDGAWQHVARSDAVGGDTNSSWSSGSSVTSASTAARSRSSRPERHCPDGCG